MCANLEAKNQDLKSVDSVQYDGELQISARASNIIDGNDVIENNGSGDETVIKKRKTRRGKPKRRNTNPYSKPTWQQRKNLNGRQAQYKYNRKFRSKIIAHGQPFAPYNSNQFLMEDHGNLQELDDKLNKSDGAGTSLHPPRTRDSSFSVDSDADFYSSPEDEEEFLTKEFDNAYEDLHAERLQSMSKNDLIEEYLQLENKVDLLTKRLKGKSTNIVENNGESVFREEMNRLMIENQDLRRENEMLRNSGVCRSPLSSSVDSESDSSSSTCSSSSSSENNVVEQQAEMPSTAPAPVLTPNPNTTHSDTNGFSPHPQSPNVV